MEISDTLEEKILEKKKELKELYLKAQESQNNSIKSNFGNILKEMRKKRGYTLREVGKGANISFTYLGNIENNTFSSPIPSKEFVDKILNFYEPTYEEEFKILKEYIYLVLPKCFTKNLTDNQIKCLLNEK